MQLKQLRQLLTKHFSLEELHTLSFDLGIDFDDFGGEGKPAKVREFIGYAERQGRLDDLLAEAADARPALPWLITPSAGIPCPYLGLAAFREKDAALFFGREAFTTLLLEAVQQTTPRRRAWTFGQWQILGRVRRSAAPVKKGRWLASGHYASRGQP